MLCFVPFFPPRGCHHSFGAVFLYGEDKITEQTGTLKSIPKAENHLQP